MSHIFRRIPELGKSGRDTAKSQGEISLQLMGIEDILFKTFGLDIR